MSLNFTWPSFEQWKLIGKVAAGVMAAVTATIGPIINWRGWKRQEQQDHDLRKKRDAEKKAGERIVRPATMAEIVPFGRRFLTQGPFAWIILAC
jgi:hypothetical protein